MNEKEILKLHQDTFDASLEQVETLEIGGIEYVPMEYFKEILGRNISVQIMIQLLVKADHSMNKQTLNGLAKVLQTLQGADWPED